MVLLVVHKQLEQSKSSVLLIQSSRLKCSQVRLRQHAPDAVISVAELLSRVTGYRNFFLLYVGSTLSLTHTKLIICFLNVFYSSSACIFRSSQETIPWVVDSISNSVQSTSTIYESQSREIVFHPPREGKQTSSNRGQNCHPSRRRR